VAKYKFSAAVATTASVNWDFQPTFRGLLSSEKEEEKEVKRRKHQAIIPFFPLQSLHLPHTLKTLCY